VATAQHALALAESQGNMPLATDLRHEIALYQAAQPFRETGK
jgi:hypothetical protein